MIKPTPELIVEARDCLEEIIEYVASETADITLLTWLKDLEAKLLIIDNRLTGPVKQQSDFEEVLNKCTGPSKIKCEVQTYGYGEDDGYGKFDATPEEVAYMQKRIEMRPDFLETRCQKTRMPYKVDIRWEPTDSFDFVEL